MNQPFYTEEFFRCSIVTLDIFNNLLKKKLIADKDMYASGEFLFADAQDNEDARNILSRIISDFDAYIEYNNSQFSHEKTGVIGLSALQEDHKSLFDYEDEIMWEPEIDEFVSRGMKENDDEDYE